MVLRLHGDGVAPTDLAAAAAWLRMPTTPAAFAGWRVIIAGALDQPRLEAALEVPTTLACIEWRGAVPALPVSLDNLARSGGTYLCLTAATAFGLYPAAAFRRAVERRYQLEAPLCDALELAVHEAIANAVIHGNLGLADISKESPKQLAAFCAALEERLADPLLAARRVHVWAMPTGRGVSVTVVDEGKGYAAGWQGNTAPDRKSGRGLALIRSLTTRTTITDGGRRITMEFVR